MKALLSLRYVEWGRHGWRHSVKALQRNSSAEEAKYKSTAHLEIIRKLVSQCPQIYSVYSEVSTSEKVNYALKLIIYGRRSINGIFDPCLVITCGKQKKIEFF